MKIDRLVPAAAVTLIAAGLALAFVVTQHVRFSADPSTVVPRGVSTAVPRLPAPARRSVTVSAPRSTPVRVIIPVIGVNAPVTDVGQNADRTIQVPPLGNHDLAAWYKYSVAPGQTGTSVIVGHVDSYTGPSVFFNLKDLRRNDRVRVQLADGDTAVFAVDGVQAAAKTAFPTRAVFGPTAIPSLRLVTCGGPFDYGTGRYLDNIIVYAHLVSRVRSCRHRCTGRQDRARAGYSHGTR